MTSRARLAGTLALLVLLIYAQAIGFGWAFDDRDYVLANPLVLEGLTPASVAAAFTEFHSANWHPLSWMSHMLDVTLFGVTPGGPHAVNVLLHALNAVLVLVVFDELTGRRVPSFVCALLFAVHPLRVESVAWISERKDLLSAAFFLLAVLSHVRYARGGGVRWYLTGLAALVLGALSKPMVVTLPCALLVLDAWPLRRWRARTAARVVLEKLPHLAVSAALVSITIASQTEYGAISELPLGVRLTGALGGVAFYVEKSFLPLGLTAHYPHPAFHADDPVAVLAPRAIAGGVLIAGGLVLGLSGARRRPELLTGLLLFLGMLVPVLGIVTVGRQAWADRYAYLPIAWLSLAVVFPLAPLFAGRARAGRALVTAVVVLLAVRAFDQARVWRDDGALWRHTLAHTGTNALAHQNLGVFLYDEGRYEEAERELRASIAIDPTVGGTQHTLSITLDALGNPEEALRHERIAVACGDPRAGWLRHLGQLELALGNTESAARAYDRLLALTPDDRDAIYDSGVVAMQRELWQQAEARFRSLLDEDPPALDVLRNLANLCLRDGRTAEGLVYLRRVVAARPDDPDGGANPEVWAALARAAFETGQRDEAIQAQSRAVELFEGQPRAQARARRTLALYSNDGG